MANQSNTTECLMANPFLFQSFLNSLPTGSPSSPNLYATPKESVANAGKKVTPEGAQKALNFLQEQTDKQITVLPDKESRGGGYFLPTEPGGGLYNSPKDASKRTVFIGPEAGYHVLFHEVGHARDPQLRKGMAKEKEFNIDTIQSLPTPAQRLEYFAETKINPRLHAETEAQAYSGFQLPRFAAANPELGIATQNVFNDPWFKEYPASYAQSGIDEFYDKETGANAFLFKEVKDRTPVAIQVGRPNTALNTLRLALDPDVQAMQQTILNKATQAVDERLNPYQTNPTALRDYWKTTY